MVWDNINFTAIWIDVKSVLDLFMWKNTWSMQNFFSGIETGAGIFSFF